MAYYIRPFQNSDVSKVVQLYEDTVRATLGKDYSLEQAEALIPQQLPLSRTSILELWRDSLNEGICMVAVEHNAVLGFGDIGPSYSNSDLRRLYVQKDKLGHGIGRALVGSLEDQARKRNIFQIELDAILYAKGFYKKMGFVPCQYVQRKFGSVSINMIRMRKTFLNHNNT
jgi:GNAT superfamily N-acetyltransferase